VGGFTGIVASSLAPATPEKLDPSTGRIARRTSVSAHETHARGTVAHVPHEGTRRDYLTLAGPAALAVGGAFTLWPFISQMNPDAGALALASIEVDLAPIKEGQAITVQWRGKPVFIRNRTKDEIDRARAVKLADLPDPAADADRVQKGKENWLVCAPISAAFRRGHQPARRRCAAIMAAGSARATARTTIRPAVSGRGLRRRT
jgi:Ubiquitinol-cytochrome C reductase Fe-S subunit TAT signal